MNVVSTLPPMASLDHRDSFDTADDLEGFDDFTIASAWERFIAKTEEILWEWKKEVASDRLASGSRVEDARTLHKVHNELAYGPKNYGVDIYFEVVNENDSREEWTDGLHPLQLWFGVKDFVVISPMSMSGVVLDAPEATLLLSTMAVALSNCGSDLPAFVPVHDPTRKAYLGIKCSKSFGVHYETDRMGSGVPVALLHLEGLFNMFISKLVYKTGKVHDTEVQFTMQLTYRTPMPGFEYHDANVEPISNYDGDLLEEMAWDEDCVWAEWHSVDDPIKGFELICTWSKQNVKSAMEAAGYENNSSTDADKWFLTLIKIKDQAPLQGNAIPGFGGRLRALVQACHVASQAKFVEDFALGKESVKQVTQHLTVPPPTVLDRVLKDLFEEAPSEFGAQMYSEHAQGLKGAPPDSLFSRFCLHALQFGTCNIRAIAVLWIEFVREVRWCWDEGLRLPRVYVNGSPDLETCLLHQKLQLLALCIEKKALHQGGTDGDDSQALPTHENGYVGDLDEERKGSTGPVDNLKLINSNHSLHAPVTQNPPMTEDMLEEWEQTLATLQKSPWGNLASHRHNKLTSDMAAFKAANPGAAFEDFRRWYSLGNQLDSNGVDEMEPDKVKIWEQVDVCAACKQKPLFDYTREAEKIDMAAFKAANPGAAFEDFRRWYSLGNQLDSNGVDEMEPDKVKIWEQVDACAACKQKPLFDYTREAEKIMHYFETIRPQQLLAQMLVCSFAVAAHALEHSVIDFIVPTLMWELEELSTAMESIFTSYEQYLRSDSKTDVTEEWQRKLLQLCALFERVESNIILAVSLQKKVGNAPRLLAALVNHHLEPHKVPVAKVLVEKTSTSNRWKEKESVDERDVVAKLFSSLTPPATWKSTPSMGHLFYGHEPLAREVIFSYESRFPDSLQTNDSSQMSKRETRHCVDLITSHRMYVNGTLNDLQIAYAEMALDS